MNQQQTQNLRGYNGNLLLKKSNQQIDWTPELVQEYVKCSNDPVYFIETYMKIINVDKGLINFKLSTLQTLASPPVTTTE